MTTKLHVACDRKGNPVGLLLSGGQRNDGVFLQKLLDRSFVATGRGYRNRPKALVADKAYGSRDNRRYLSGRKIKAQIPAKKLPKGQKRRQKGPKPKLDPGIYKERNVIERLFCRLKECRRVLTRFEKLADAFLAFVQLACIRMTLKRYFSDKP